MHDLCSEKCLVTLLYYWVCFCGSCYLLVSNFANKQTFSSFLFNCTEFTIILDSLFRNSLKYFSNNDLSSYNGFSSFKLYLSATGLCVKWSLRAYLSPDTLYFWWRTRFWGKIFFFPFSCHRIYHCSNLVGSFLQRFPDTKLWNYYLKLFHLFSTA